MEVNIHEAKTQLSSLIEAPRLVLASARGAFVLNDTWDQPLTDGEIEELFGR